MIYFLDCKKTTKKTVFVGSNVWQHLTTFVRPTFCTMAWWWLLNCALGLPAFHSLMSFIGTVSDLARSVCLAFAPRWIHNGRFLPRSWALHYLFSALRWTRLSHRCWAQRASHGTGVGGVQPRQTEEQFACCPSCLPVCLWGDPNESHHHHRGMEQLLLAFSGNEDFTLSLRAFLRRRFNAMSCMICRAALRNEGVLKMLEPLSLSECILIVKAQYWDLIVRSILCNGL